MAKTSVKNGKKQKPMEWKKQEDRNDIIEDSGKILRELNQLRSNISSLRWKLVLYSKYYLSLKAGSNPLSIDNALRSLASAPHDLMRISSTIETLHANLIG